MKKINIKSATLVALAALTCASYAAPITYTWTGSGGSWSNTANWLGGTIPDDYGSTERGLTFADEDSKIVFSAGAVPTSDVPDFGSQYSRNTPGLVLTSGGTLSISGGYGKGGNSSRSISTTRDVFTVGGGASAVTLNYDFAAGHRLNRNRTGTVIYTVGANGTLNLSAATDTKICFSYTTATVFAESALFIDGGTVNIDEELVNLTAYPGSYIDFTAVDGSLTAKFGSDFADIVAVNAQIGDSFRSSNGGMVAALDNGNGTFTVRSVAASKPINIDYESQTTGEQPENAIIIPAANAGSLYVKVVRDLDGNQSVELFDTSIQSTVSLVYDLRQLPVSVTSAQRIDFTFLKGTNAYVESPIVVAEGGAMRYTNYISELRIYEDDTIEFTSGTTNSIRDVLQLGKNKLSIFINDYDIDPVIYEGINNQFYILAPNSIAYWFNGKLVKFADKEYADLNLLAITPNGQIGNSENNLLRFGFFSGPWATNSNFLIDDVTSKNLTTSRTNIYFNWITSFLGAEGELNLLADPDLDKINNLLEYALGKNPSVEDNPRELTKYAIINDQEGRWFEYVYNRRVDYKARGLKYHTVTTDDLLLPMTNAVVDFVASSIENGFESVTNRISIDGENKGFIRLNVELVE